MIYIGLGALAIAVAAIGFILAPEGRQTPLPAPFEAVFPIPNNAVIRQTSIEVDLEIGYEATILVDGFPIPPSEIALSDGTNTYRWSPSFTSAIMEVWEPGDHTVTVRWVRITGAPLEGEFEWTFRVQ